MSSLSRSQKVIYTFFLILFLIGIILRVAGISEMSLTNDELSGIYTSQNFSNLESLVDKARYHHAHPLGYRVFMYGWAQWVGEQVGLLRIPFVVLGCLCIPLIFLIAQFWFGSFSALIATAWFSVLIFPLRFAQLARPYAPALFFMLFAIWCWNYIIFGKLRKKYFRWLWVGWIVGSVGAMYWHYFSFLMIGIVGVSGLCFLKEDNWKMYLLSGAIIIGTFLPHLPITWDQLIVKQGLTWLPSPTYWFGPKFIYYAFNRSYFLCLAFLVFSLGPIAYFWYRKKRWTKFHTLCLIWFLTPLVLGFAYSKWVSPVMHKRALLFAFPFLIIGSVGFGPRHYNLKKLILLGVLLFVITSAGLGSLFIEKKYYRTKQGGFKYMVESICQWEKKYDCPTTATLNIYSPHYIHFYLDKRPQCKVTFEQYRSDKAATQRELTQIIEQTAQPCFLYGWLKAKTQPSNRRAILNKFPVIKAIERPTSNAGVVYFSRKDRGKVVAQNIPPENKAQIKEHPTWQGSRSLVTGKVGDSSHIFRIGPKNRYSITYTSNGQSLKEVSAQLLRVGGVFWFTTSNPGYLVISFRHKDSQQPYAWYGFNIARLKGIPVQEWTSLYWEKMIPSSLQKDDKVKAYMWSPHGKKTYIAQLNVMALKR